MFLETLNTTIKTIWPQITIILVLLITIRIVAIKNSNKQFVFHEEASKLIFVIYVLLLFELLTGTENSTGSGVNLIPFSEIFRYKLGSSMFIYNVLGNILLFLPYGYFVSKYANVKNIWQILLVSLITSFTIELLQLQLGRTFDVDDILLNVTGGILGYFIYISFNAIKKHLPNFLKSDFIYNAICFIILVAILLYVLHISGIWRI